MILSAKLFLQIFWIKHKTQLGDVFSDSRNVFVNFSDRFKKFLKFWVFIFHSYKTWFGVFHFFGEPNHFFSDFLHVVLLFEKRRLCLIISAESWSVDFSLWSAGITRIIWKASIIQLRSFLTRFSRLWFKSLIIEHSRSLRLNCAIKLPVPFTLLQLTF